VSYIIHVNYGSEEYSSKLRVNILVNQRYATMLEYLRRKSIKDINDEFELKTLLELIENVKSKDEIEVKKIVYALIYNGFIRSTA